jgi:uncharacterized membrane protein
MRKQILVPGIIVAIIGLIILVSGETGLLYGVCSYPTNQYITTTLPNGVVSTTTIIPPPCSADVGNMDASYVGFAVFLFGLLVIGLSFLRQSKHQPKINREKLEDSGI